MLSSNKGQSLEDKLGAIKCFISGQGLSFVVLKATTSELLGPKKKHLNYLVTITFEPNVSIPNMVKYLMQRARSPEWSVAFKSLITIHYLMSYGNEKFIQNLSSSTAYHRTFEHLASFSDRSSTRAYDMSIFVRRHSRYIMVKIHSYKSLGLDFCRQAINYDLKSESESSSKLLSGSAIKIRSLSYDQLMTMMPILQKQFDSLLAFDVSIRDLNNGIINSAFAMLYKDFVKLYITYQSVTIRLLELYFNTKQLKQAQDMLETYKKFLISMDKVSDFMRIIDSVGMDKSDMPNVSRAPTSLTLKVLEKHFEQLLETNKRQQLATLTRIQSIELPKIDYGTFGRRRNSLRRTNTNSECSSPFKSDCNKIASFTKQPFKLFEDSVQEDDMSANTSVIFDSQQSPRKAMASSVGETTTNKDRQVNESGADLFFLESVNGAISNDQQSLMLLEEEEEEEEKEELKDEDNCDKKNADERSFTANQLSEWVQVDL